MTYLGDNLPDDSAQLSAQEHRLQAHLAAELDPHVGRARRRFEQMLAESAEPAPLRLRGAGGPSVWNRRWSMGLLAAAACIAFAVGLWGVFDSGGWRGTELSGGKLAKEARFTPLEYSESWQSEDLGTYKFDGRPVRAVHQQQWETTRYRDAQGYEVEIEVPRTQLVLVDAPVQ